MNMNKSFEELNKKCKLLEELGFTINHQDCDVSFETVNAEFDDFNFSATASDTPSIIYTALKHVYAQGLEDGMRNARQQMREALGLEE